MTQEKQTSQEQPKTLVINGTAYLTESVTEAGQRLVQQVQITEGAIQRHQVDLGVAQTAREVFINELAKEAEANFEVAPEELQPKQETEDTAE